MGLSTRSLAAGAALLLIMGLGREAAAPPRKDAERGVRRTLMRLNGFLANHDADGAAGDFWTGGETLLIAGGVDEILRGHAAIADYYRALMGAPGAYAFSWREVQVEVRNGIASLFADGELVHTPETGPATRSPYRVSGVLEQQAGRWKWRQFHGSRPHA